MARADGAPFGEPCTVGDVVALHARRQLREIRGLGPRRISEIEAALVLAGLDLTRQRERPTAGKDPPPPATKRSQPGGGAKKRDRSG